MPASMRARLTVWYTAFLVAALAAFCGVILSLHWHTLVRQHDASLDAMSGAAATTFHNELAEGTSVHDSAAESEELLRSPGIVVRVLDARGDDLGARRPAPVAPSAGAPQDGHLTLRDGDGQSWRVATRAVSERGAAYFVQVSGSLQAPVQQWESLLRACLAGLPIVLLAAGAGGWWLARRGLRPLDTMAAEARAITAESADRRLTAAVGNAELDALAADFNVVLDRLATALTNQRRFMADASHELRTPLTTIRTAADVTLSQSTRSAEEYRDALAAISQQSARLGRLVDDMFLLARADAGGYPVNFGEVDLAGIVQDCVAALSPLARERGVGLSVAVPDSAPVHGDEALLHRLVLNLVQNALAYSGEGGRARVDLTAAGGYFELRVADSGAGIPDSERTRIFERFVRLDPSRHRGGAGLGLSIARWIAQVHGGMLDLASTGPAGSVFVARFHASQGVAS